MNDIIHGNRITGEVASGLAEVDFDVNYLRPYYGSDRRAYVTQNGVAVPYFQANATLRKDEWLELDTAIIEEAEERLIGVQDLLSAGLTMNLSDGLGTTSLEWENVDDFSPAEISMDAVTQSNADRPNYELESIPLPIIHKDFNFNLRQLRSSRKRGETLDVTSARLASRQVSETVEDLLFAGTPTYAYAGGTIFGYLTHPDRNTVTLTENWDAAGKTGEEILADVLAMKQASINANFTGPFWLYIPQAYDTTLDDDFKSEVSQTIRQRLMQVEGIDKITVADKLTANTVVLVQHTTDVVRIVNGLPLTTVQWEGNGGMRQNFKVMTIMIPNIRATQGNRSGVTVLS